MAFSSSITRAQEIKLCELCQEDSIKWRCIDCNKCLCEKCKTMHLQVPVTVQHQIVTIRTPLQDVQKMIIMDNIPCKDHPKKMTCLFCKSCNSLICPDCVSSSHKKHNFDSIESALYEKMDNLRGIYDKIGDNLKFYESKTSELQYLIAKHNAIFDGSLTKIKQNEQELITAIRKHSNDLQVKVKNERIKVNSILSNIKENVDKTKKTLEDQRKEIDVTLTSNKGGAIFKSTVNIKDLKFDSSPIQVEGFIPKTISTKKIRELFGTFQKKSIIIIRVTPDMDCEVIRPFTTDLPYIATGVTLDETSAWISCQSKELIRLVNIQDNNMVTSQEVSLKVSDMALTQEKDLLLTVYSDSDVKLLSRSGEIVTFLTVEPLVPIAIHVTQDNDVIVGVKEPSNPFTPTDQSKRAVIVYGINGKQKHIYQYDNNGKRLFTLPRRITTNNNQDILVVDRTSENTGRVVVLNKEGNFRWIYEGHHKINAFVRFVPVDIVSTTVGHIIVSDYRSHALHVLSEDGDVLTCRVIKDMGIMWPWGLDIDNKGRLWLGCGTGGEQTGAKLHIIMLNSKDCR